MNTLIHPYHSSYLYDVMQNMAEAFDEAQNTYAIDLDTFLHMFISSGIAAEFEAGNPKYLAGFSGPALLMEIICLTMPSFDIKPFSASVSTLDTNITQSNTAPFSFRSPAYWTGWVLANAQWETGYSFHKIQTLISMQELTSMYYPLHEADEGHIVEIILERESQKTAKNLGQRLQAYRKALGYSQRGLSENAGINLRTLQQYEIGGKNLKKASAETLYSMSKALGCSIENLLQA